MTDENDQSDERAGEVPIEVTSGDEAGPRKRIEARAGRAIDGLDRGIVDVLGWLLETETRTRIYVHLRTAPHSTSEEIAEGTGLYPSTVREAVAALHDEGIVIREKRVHEGAGNNPYEYQAIPPSELVSTMLSTVQRQLNDLINLDSYLREDEPTTESDPITISVDEVDDELDDPADDESPAEDEERSN